VNARGVPRNALRRGENPIREKEYNWLKIGFYCVGRTQLMTLREKKVADYDTIRGTGV